MAIQNATKKTMKEYLNSNYYIPSNQRDYTWEEDQLADFWDDLKSVVGLNEARHFFGQIVIYSETDSKGKSKKYVVDGQQRTVTSMLFLRTLQYVADNLIKEITGDDADAEDAKDALKNFDSSIIQILGSRAGKYTPDSKLHLTFESELEENDYYGKHIMGGEPSSEKQKNSACDHMRFAYNYLHTMFSKAVDACKDLDEKIRLLHTYRDAFFDQFEVMYIETNDLGESYVIFETLNARGKELETSDLLKNYVFSKAGGNLQTVQQKWKNMSSKLHGLDLTKYIRYYWNAMHGVVRERNLYREISKEIKSPKESADLVDDLLYLASYFHDANTPDNCDVYEDDEIIERLSNLHTLKATSFVPILLALEMKGNQFKTEDKVKVLWAIEVYVFRNSTILGKLANKTEVFFAELAKDIYEEKLQKSEDIIEKINDERVPDKTFENQFREFSTQTTNYIRYIFSMIHDHLCSNQETQLNPNVKDVNIEHILPKNITNWKNIDAKTQEKYLWRLGNLTLLDNKLNKKGSNHTFAEKKEAYKKSKIETTNSLTKYDEWTPTQIEERQKELAKIALEIWK